MDIYVLIIGVMLVAIAAAIAGFVVGVALANVPAKTDIS